MKKSVIKEKMPIKNVVNENTIQEVAKVKSTIGLKEAIAHLSNLPSNADMSYIYVQLLSPEHKVVFSEILSEHTKKEVHEIDDLAKKNPNNVIIIQYNKEIEEIESANEELTKINKELQSRNDLLNEAYEYAEAITDTVHDAMIVLDKNLRIKSANKSFYKKFKVKAEETEGIFLFDLGNKQWNIPALRDFLQEIITKKNRFLGYEVAHNFPNIGEKRMLLNASRVIQKKHGEELILLSIYDITDLRKLEAEKQAIEKELHKKEMQLQKTHAVILEKTVKQRTKDLVQVNQELEKMNKELESFTFISSHDLQEPLRKIQTFAGRILDKEHQNLSENGKNYFHLMQNAAQRMQTLIQDLLAFSRIRVADRKFETTDLNIIIEEVKNELKESIAEKGAILLVKQTCNVNIIPFQFRQLIFNLISNSLKFSNPKVAKVITVDACIIKYSNLKVANLPKQKEYCHITITDNGIGFETEFAEKIFEVFQKLHSKDEYAGTGIGLAIVKKIVENHKGIITATSILDKGTTFNIYIPA